MAKRKSVEKPDSSGPVRHLNHNAFPVEARGVSLLQAAINYLKDNAEYYHLSMDDIEKMVLQLEGKWVEEGSSFRFETQKEIMDLMTFVFVQTYSGLPVWEAGISVSIDRKKNRILSSLSSAYDDIEVSTVDRAKLEKEIEVPALLQALGTEKETKSRKSEIKILSERLLVYQFLANKRTIFSRGSI